MVKNNNEKDADDHEDTALRGIQRPAIAKVRRTPANDRLRQLRQNLALQAAAEGVNVKKSREAGANVRKNAKNVVKVGEKLALDQNSDSATASESSENGTALPSTKQKSWFSSKFGEKFPAAPVLESSAASVSNNTQNADKDFATAAASRNQNWWLPPKFPDKFAAESAKITAAPVLQNSAATTTASNRKRKCSDPVNVPKVAKIDSDKSSSIANRIVRVAKYCLNIGVNTPAIAKRKTAEDAVKKVAPITNTSLQQIEKPASNINVASSTLSIPSYKKGSANQRLQLIRQTLLKQTQQEEQNVSNSLQHIDRTQTEVMEWEPISNDSIKENTINAADEAAEVSTQQSIAKVAIMADNYDQLEANLIRNYAEQQGTKTKKFHQDFHYCVVDTNVLLQHLTIIKQLCHKRFDDSKGCIVYVPYIVLQELDKLKMNDKLRTLTTRAIKYLNSQFDAKNDALQAQSALQERAPLIKIESADDRIINCCLQLKLHVSRVLLLSEDNNLRNKAAANDIPTMTKSQLLGNSLGAISTDLATT